MSNSEKRDPRYLKSRWDFLTRIIPMLEKETKLKGGKMHQKMFEFFKETIYDKEKVKFVICEKYIILNVPKASLPITIDAIGLQEKGKKLIFLEIETNFNQIFFQISRFLWLYYCNARIIFRIPYKKGKKCKS